MCQDSQHHQVALQGFVTAWKTVSPELCREICQQESF